MTFPDLMVGLVFASSMGCYWLSATLGERVLGLSCATAIAMVVWLAGAGVLS